MKKCDNCRFFVITDYESGIGVCCVEPPRKSSEKGGSYRPSVSHTDPACQHFRPPMPAAANINGDVTMTLKVEIDPALKRILDALPKAEQIRLGHEASKPEAKPEATKPSHGPKRFCYAPQSATLRALMRECGMPHDDIQIVQNADCLRGRSGGIFLAVNGHKAALPSDVFEAVVKAGMIAVTISDAWLRAKLEKVIGG